MPIHDWTTVDAGLFHHFHQNWTVALCDALNAGVLPSDYFSLVEQIIPGSVPDVLTLKLAERAERPRDETAALALATAPPKARLVARTEADVYARRANQLTIRHRHGDVVAVIEIVSPGNKASRAEFRTFVEKSADFIRQGVHLLIVDLFPPTPRDRQGVHKAIWDELIEEDFRLPADRPLTVVSYLAAAERRAYAENLAVGDMLPEMPIFLTHELYVPAPLEKTYQTAWGMFPGALKRLLEAPVNGTDDED